MFNWNFEFSERLKYVEIECHRKILFQYTVSLDLGREAVGCKRYYFPIGAGKAYSIS